MVNCICECYSYVHIKVKFNIDNCIIRVKVQAGIKYFCDNYINN